MAPVHRRLAGLAWCHGGKDRDDEWQPSREAEMFSRELIQNFWDAALDQKMAVAKAEGDEHQPSIEFVFRTLSGD